MLADEYNLSFMSLSAYIQPTEFYQLLLLSSSSLPAGRSFSISSGSRLDIKKYQHSSKHWTLHSTLMRFFKTIAALFLFSACKSSFRQENKSTDWTEEEKRNYFSDSLATRYGFGRFLENDSTKTFAFFFKTRYPNIKAKNSDDPFPYAFEEEYIDTTKLDASRNWFRLMVSPCFRLPYCFIVEKKYGKTFLTTKITNGDGGYHTGDLIITMRFPFGDTLYNSISKELNDLIFWRLGNDTSCVGGLDGETWTFEAIENSKYNIINRWAPQGCGNYNTQRLSKIGLKLADLSKLDNVLEAIGAPKSGM